MVCYSAGWLMKGLMTIDLLDVQKTEMHMVSMFEIVVHSSRGRGHCSIDLSFCRVIEGPIYS